YPTNFLKGLDLAGSRTAVPSYGQVAYRGLYDGIDLVYAATPSGTKYEFLLAPGASVADVAIRFDGADSIRMDAAGNVIVHTAAGDLLDAAPTGDQKGRAVPCGFVLRDSTTVGYRCPDTNGDLPLRIDPLIYATYLGSTGVDQVAAVVADSIGNAYVTGTAGGPDFPTTTGAFDRTFGGGCDTLSCADAFVAMLNPSGTGLIYATFLGGTSWDYGSSIAVDSAGGVHVAGHSFSSDFPTTVGAFNRTFQGHAAFASMLSSTGSALSYSTFIGDGRAHAIQVDAAGNAYIAGETSDRYFPTTPGALKTTFTTMDGFITKLNPSGSGLNYSTLFGGNLYDYVDAMTVDASGDAFITGATNSSDFPFTPGAWNTTFPRATRGGYPYVAELNPSGSALNYATFIGGTSGSSTGTAIAVDSAGNAFVVGSTFDLDFPTTPGAVQPSH